MLEIIFFTSIIVGVLMLVGIGIASLVLPKSLSEDAVWIAPWVGIVFITVLSVYLSMMGISMQYAVWIVLSISLVVLMFAIHKRKIRFNLDSELAMLIALTLVAFLFNISHLMNVGFATVISMGNLDPLAYVNPADFLLTHGVFGNTFDVGTYPAHAALADIINYSYRWGTVVIISFFASILSVSSYQVYSILITVSFVFTFPLVYVLAKQLGEVSHKFRWILMGATFLTYGLNSTLLYILYNVFIGQVIFDGLLILFIILLVAYLRSHESSALITAEAVAAGVALGATYVIYPDGLIMLYVPIVGFAVFSSFIEKRLHSAKKIGKVILVSIIVNPFIFFIAAKWASRLFRVTTSDQKIGWEFIRTSFPHEFLGFYNINYYRDLWLPLDLLFALPLITIMVLGFLRIKEKLLMGMYLLFFGSLLIVFKLVSPNFFVFHRTITYSLFLFSVLFALGLVPLYENITQKKLLIAFFVVLALLSFRSGKRTHSQMSHHMRIVDRSLISLKEVDNMSNIDEPIVVSDAFAPTYDVWVRLWREHFLINKKIITLSNLASHKEEVTKDSFVLLEKSPIYAGSSVLLMNNIVWENNYYRLGKLCKNDTCLLESSEDLSYIDFSNAPYQDILLGEGWDAREETQRWISSSEASLKLITKTPPRALSFVARAIKVPLSMKVIINDTQTGIIVLKEAPKKYMLPIKVPVASGVVNIQFVPDNTYVPAELGINLDTRSLSVSFEKIKLE